MGRFNCNVGMSSCDVGMTREKTTNCILTSTSMKKDRTGNQSSEIQLFKFQIETLISVAHTHLAPCLVFLVLLFLLCWVLNLALQRSTLTRSNKYIPFLDFALAQVFFLNSLGWPKTHCVTQDSLGFEILYLVTNTNDFKGASYLSLMLFQR